MTKDEKRAQHLPHGGDWAGFTIEYGREPLDFSMNVNPLGISAKVQAAIAKAGASSDRYPDPLCRALVQKLAQHEAVPPEWIFCGNGAADIIFRLAQALKPGAGSQSTDSRDADRQNHVCPAGQCEVGEARQLDIAARRPKLLITAPTFSEYETAFTENGWEVERFLLREENGFQITEEILDRIGPEVNMDDSEEGNVNTSGAMYSAGSASETTSEGTADVLFLCEPNNPTGVTTDGQLLRKIWERCKQTGTTLVIDECFNGFLEKAEAHSMKSMLNGEASRSGNLIILKAFTKLYGMAGVRLGYCLCPDGEILERIRQAGPPWNVSGLAQAAGVAALEDREHVEQGLRIIREERPWLREQLGRLGIRKVYGEANYLLFFAEPDDCAAGLDEKMREHGILIRNCANYPGLGEGWYRIAVRTHEENEQLIKALREELT